MTYKDKGSYESSPPCRVCNTEEQTRNRVAIRKSRHVKESLLRDTVYRLFSAEEPYESWLFCEK